MGLWDVIVPEPVVNIVTNPSFEPGTGGWAGYGAGVIARSTDDPPFGLYNLKVTCTIAVWDGCYTSFVSANTFTYTGSVYFKGETGIPYKLFFTNAAGNHVSTATTFTGDGNWHRYENTYTAEATETLLLVTCKLNNASNTPFYVDAAQIEFGSEATTYCDGDQPDSVWIGVHHASTSYRWYWSRAGGWIRNLEDDYHFYIESPLGVGAPPVRNFFTDYALLKGALHEHTKIYGRLFALHGLLLGTSLENLHTRRAALYDILKPDESRGQPVLMRYSGRSETLEIAAYYDGGLEVGIKKGFSEKLAIRFYCPQPDWRGVIT